MIQIKPAPFSGDRTARHAATNTLCHSTTGVTARIGGQNARLLPIKTPAPCNDGQVLFGFAAPGKGPPGRRASGTFR